MTYFQRDNKPKETADVLYKYNTILSVLSSTYLRSIGTEGKSVIYMRPDKRYKPACYVYKSKCDTIHKWVKRSIRDLDFGPTHVSIECIYRQIFCMTCGGILVEDMVFFEPSRLHRRFPPPARHGRSRDEPVTDRHV